MSEPVRTRNEIWYFSLVALELVIRTSGTEPILYKNEKLSVKTFQPKVQI